MNVKQFAYWFQGFAELTPNPPDAEQWAMIRARLAESSTRNQTIIETKPLQIKVDTKSLKQMTDRVAKSVRRAKGRVA